MNADTALSNWLEKFEQLMWLLIYVDNTRKHLRSIHEKEKVKAEMKWQKRKCSLKLKIYMKLELARKLYREN